MVAIEENIVITFEENETYAKLVPKPCLDTVFWGIGLEEIEMLFSSKKNGIIITSTVSEKRMH